MPKWTNEQLDAINKSGTNIIVSAGAGSGKTAVLSERVLRILKEGTHIDELLILTFTNAAAKEMKERIELLKFAHECGCETWISFEPVLEPNYILNLLESDFMNYVTTVKLGKLNHMDLKDLTSNENDIINWKAYGEKAVEICKKRNINYVIKSALLKEMNS